MGIAIPLHTQLDKKPTIIHIINIKKMKQRFLLLMMTALLSVGAWAADDVTLNVGEASGSWGVTNNGGSMTIQQYASSGWEVNLSPDEYCGIEVEYSTSTPRIYLQIWYEGDIGKENPSQSIELSTSATTLKTYFSPTGTIKKIVFKYGEWEGSPSDASITVTSAVVKAYDSDKDFTLNMTYANNFNNWGTFNVSGSTIEVAQWSEGGWLVPLNKDKYCGVDFSFTATTAKIYLKIVYADATEQSIEIPDFIQNANISKIGFKHGDNDNKSNVSITITSAVVKAESKGEKVNLDLSKLSETTDGVTTLTRYSTYASIGFTPIYTNDYEKAIVTFSTKVANDNIGINAESTTDDWPGTTLGTATKGTTKAVVYFSEKPDVDIKTIGFYYGYSGDAGNTATLQVSGITLVKKPTQSITINEMTHGTVTASVTEAWEGKTVILTPVPDGNYELGTLTVTDGNSASVAVTDNGDGTYTFTMPATAVTVSATFTPTVPTALNTENIKLTNSQRSNEGDGTVKLYIDGTETNGWDFTIGRPVSSTEFAGVEVKYKEAVNVQMVITYGDDSSNTQSFTAAEGSTNTAYITFDAGKIVKSIKFGRVNTPSDGRIQFQSQNAVRLVGIVGASTYVPTSSLTLTYGTLMDSGSGSVEYDKVDKTFEIKSGTGHWAFWDFTLPLPTSLYKGINFNLTQAPAGSKIEIIYDGDVANPQQVSIGGETIYNVNFDRTGNVTRIRFAGTGIYKMGTCTAKPAKYQVTVSTAQYATFGDLGSPDVIDYGSADPSGLKAYIAYVEGSKVKLEEVSKATANTAVILYADVTKATSYTVTTTEASASTTAHTNDLKISDGTIESDGSIYVLANKTKGVGFYLLTPGQKVLAGKAYLKVTGSGSRSFIGIGDDTTGIDEVSSKTEEVRSDYFDLQGRRVAQPTKGVIVK